jgi:WD40 repeat protein
LGRLVLLVLLLAAAWTGWLLWPARPLARWVGPSGGRSDYCEPTSDGRTLVAYPCTTHVRIDADGIWGDSLRVGPVRLLDLSAGQEGCRPLGTDTQEELLRFAPDGSWVLVRRADGRLYILDTDTGRERSTIPITPGGLWRHAVAPDGRTLALAGDDHQVRLCDTASGRVAAMLPAVQPDLAFTRDGRTLFTAGPATGDDLRPDNTRPRGVVRAWDAATGKLRATLDLPPFAPIALAPSPDGRRLALYRFGFPVDRFGDTNWWFGLKRHGLGLWPVGEVGALQLWDVDRAESPVVVATYSHDMSQPERLEFSPDGRLLVLRTGGGSRLIWDVTRDPPECLDRLFFEVDLPDQKLKTYLFPAFTPDGRMVVPGPEADGPMLGLWDTADFRFRAAYRLRYPREDAAPVFAPDGRTFALLFSNRMKLVDQVEEWLKETFHLPLTLPHRYVVQLFATDTGAELGTRTVPGDDVSLIGFAPDGASFWTAARTADPATGEAVRLVERWAVPSPWPPAWLLAVTAFGVLLAVADRWRSRRRRVAAAGTGGPTA